MATNTTNDEKYSRLVLMLVKGGTKITKALFEKHFKAMTPKDHDPSPWTIDEFLQANKQKILSNQTGRAKKWIFFPDASVTEIDLWDLYTFCYVLVDVCGVLYAIRMDIDKLKRMRNELCHLNKPSVDTKTYERHAFDIKCCFDRLLAEIDDKVLTEEIAKVLQAAKEEPLSHQDTINVVYEFSKMAEETREILSQQSKDIKEIRRKMIEMEKKLDLMLKNQKPNQTEKVKVPEIIIELLVKNCDSENEVVISKLLVDMYKEVTGRSTTDEHSGEEYSKMMTAVRDIVDRFTAHDRPIVDAEQRCIIFRIRCTSVASLISLFDDCIAGNLNKEFKPLEACIREIKGCEEVTLELVIFEDEVWKTISQTISSLEEMISRLYNTEFQSSVRNQNSAISSISDVNLVERRSPTMEDEKRIHHAVRLTIRTDQDGKEQLKESVKNGSFDSSINRLREEVVDHFDLTKLSIEARVVDEESPSFAGADQVLVNIPSNEFTNYYKEDNFNEDTRVSWKQNVGAVSKEPEDEYEKNVSRDSDIAIRASPVEVQGLLNLREQLLTLQAIVRENFETARTRTHQYTRDIANKNNELEIIDERLTEIDKTIKEYETSAENFERQANNLAASSNESVGKSILQIGGGIAGSILSVAAGAALAPFTGGASLVFGGMAAGASVGENAVAAGVNIGEAKDFQERANNARLNARDARYKRRKLVDEKISLSAEMQHLEQKRDELNIQVGHITEFQGFLYSCECSINRFHSYCNVQNVETVMTLADDIAQTFEIAQRAFAKHGNKYEMAPRKLKDLKESWSHLASLIPSLSTA